MITYPKTNNDPVAAIAVCLITHFAKPVYDFYNGKSYRLYVKSMEEIIDWSFEFHTQYYHRLKDWDAFKVSDDNIYNAADRESFLVSWGDCRIKEFFIHQENKMHTGRGNCNPVNTENFYT